MKSRFLLVVFIIWFVVAIILSGFVLFFINILQNFHLVFSVFSWILLAGITITVLFEFVSSLRELKRLIFNIDKLMSDDGFCYQVALLKAKRKTCCNFSDLITNFVLRRCFARYLKK